MAGPPGPRPVLAGEGGRSHKDQSADLYHWRLAGHLSGGHALGLFPPQMPKENLDGALDAHAPRARSVRTARLPARDEALGRSLAPRGVERPCAFAAGTDQRPAREHLEA